MIALVTDSTCDLPTEFVEQHQIHVVPQHIIWGAQSYRDGIDIDSHTFYSRLAEAAEMPKTSQPTPFDFLRAYQMVRDETNADEILSVVLSHKLSATYASAMQAAEEFNGHVRVVDSLQASMGIGFLLLKAAEMRDAGAGLEEIAVHLEARRSEIDVYFSVATLDFLHRGGRIGKARHLVGKALQIKPILHIVDGEVAAQESVRTRNKALNKVVELVSEKVANKAVRRLAIVHGNVPDEAEALASVVRQELAPTQLITSHVCPTVGTHAGPGAIGIAYDVE